MTEAIESRLRELVIETPSWGYGDSGTRFGDLPAGRAARATSSSASTTPPRSTA